MPLLRLRRSAMAKYLPRKCTCCCTPLLRVAALGERPMTTPTVDPLKKDLDLARRISFTIELSARQLDIELDAHSHWKFSWKGFWSRPQPHRGSSSQQYTK